MNNLLIAGAADRVCEIDRYTKEVRFGDGSHGMIPPAGSFIRVRYSESVDEAEYGSVGSALRKRVVDEFVARLRGRERRNLDSLGLRDVARGDDGFEAHPRVGIHRAFAEQRDGVRQTVRPRSCHARSV